MKQRTILCVSFDKTASDSRCFALREAGYDVAATSSVEEAFGRLDSIKFDLMIVGHRFGKDDKKALISEARQRWHTPVLLICGASPESDLEADARVFAIEDVEGLLKTVSRLLPLTAAV